jgi:hypothetical protein
VNTINTIDSDIRDFLLSCKGSVADLHWSYHTDKKGTTLHIVFLGEGKPVYLPDEFWKNIGLIRAKYGINIQITNN